MLFSSGPSPEFVRICAAVVCLATSHISVADWRAPLSLAEAERLAQSGEPGEAELLAVAEALGNRAVAAGQLPDPSLRVGLVNFPLNGGFSAEPMTQAQLGIRQVFPRRDARRSAANRLTALASATSESAAARKRDVLQATRVAWFDIHYWQQAETILTESRDLFVDLLDVTRSLYATGRKSQHDVVRAELALGQHDDRVIEAVRARSAAQAALAEWIGADALRPVVSKLPGWNAPPDLSLLQSRIAGHPSVLAAAATVDASTAAVSRAEQDKKPGWALDIGYGYRDGVLPGGEARSDMITVNVSVGLPLFAENRQDREVSAALSERSAAIAARNRQVARLQSELTLQHTRWSELNRRLELYETRILGLAANQSESALLAYQSDAGDFADVVQGYIDEIDTRITHIQIQVERVKSHAALANLGGLLE